VDSQVATNNLGPGTSHVGNIKVVPVYRLQKPPLSAPIPLTPPDSAAENAGQRDFSWSAVPDAEYYVLQFSTYSNFQPVSYSRRIYGTSQTVSLDAGGTGNVAYYWRVNAANTGGASAWSQARKYTLDAPAKPNLYSPGWASQNQPLSVTIAWRSVASSVRYHLEITPTRQNESSWPTGTPLLFGDSLFTDTVKVLSGLSAGTPYSIRVRAQNAGGAVSQWTIGLFFTAAVTGMVFDLSLPREFSLAQSSKVIRYGLPAPSRVSLKIFDLKGRLAATLVDAMQDPGYYTLAVRDVPLSRGTFITDFKAGPFSKRGLIWISGE
jgi:hypothetical protein